MSALAYKKRQDQQIQTDRSQLDYKDSLGTWINTNDKTRGIAKVILALDESGNQMTLRAFGTDELTPRDWGIVAVDDLYANNPTAQQINSFTARYNFDFMEIELQANQSKGLLIIAAHHVFRDNSGRSNYFCREYFHKQG